jgi:hypothetical protein
MNNHTAPSQTTPARRLPSEDQFLAMLESNESSRQVPGRSALLMLVVSRGMPLDLTVSEFETLFIDCEGDRS